MTKQATEPQKNLVYERNILVNIFSHVWGFSSVSIFRQNGFSIASI